MDIVESTISFLADFLTIIASGIAIYLFFWKGKYISTVLKVLVNYSSQLTLSELKDKLDSLNGLRATDDEGREEIVNILHDVMGQLKGNPKLTPHFAEIIKKIEKATTSKNKIGEPWKRSIVSEIREKIRHVSVLTFEEISGDGK